ncbi:MAG: hypothetical protein GW855_01735 [Erythrobacter sp.]|nr:hypothetical protein [Erythrobacter sp.]NCQ64650.1 hypothetical protein [Alphaproteobacteria bacterium]
MLNGPIATFLDGSVGAPSTIFELVFVQVAFLQVSLFAALGLHVRRNLRFAFRPIPLFFLTTGSPNFLSIIRQLRGPANFNWRIPGSNAVEQVYLVPGRLARYFLAFGYILAGSAAIAPIGTLSPRLAVMCIAVAFLCIPISYIAIKATTGGVDSMIFAKGWRKTKGFLVKGVFWAAPPVLVWLLYLHGTVKSGFEASDFRDELFVLLQVLGWVAWLAPTLLFVVLAVPVLPLRFGDLPHAEYRQMRALMMPFSLGVAKWPNAWRSWWARVALRRPFPFVAHCLIRVRNLMTRIRVVLTGSRDRPMKGSSPISERVIYELNELFRLPRALICALLVPNYYARSPASWFGRNTTSWALSNAAAISLLNPFLNQMTDRPNGFGLTYLPVLKYFFYCWSPAWASGVVVLFFTATKSVSPEQASLMVIAWLVATGFFTMIEWSHFENDFVLHEARHYRDFSRLPISLIPDVEADELPVAVSSIQAKATVWSLAVATVGYATLLLTMIAAMNASDAPPGPHLINTEQIRNG